MKKNTFKNKGFSVVELIVVIGIFVLMSTISMFQYNEHIAKIETDELAQDIALSIRQAQVYGISASGGNIGSENFEDDQFLSEFFDGAEGVVTNITQDRSIRGISFLYDKKTMIIFEDLNRNFVYDASDRMIDERTIKYPETKFTMFTFCSLDGGCSKAESGRIDISFERPYPDAVIYYMPNEGNTAGAKPFNKVKITVGGSGSERNIEINSIGNIVVK